MRSLIRWTTRVVCLAAGSLLVGCQGIRTEATIRTPQPVQAEVAATVTPNTDPGPLLEVFPEQNTTEECTGPKLAIVDVDGLLVNASAAGLSAPGENPVAIFAERLAAAERDTNVRAVVVRINSAGGGVTASDVMVEEIRSFKRRTNRPVVACLMDVGAGGGYYLASVCDYVVCHPTSLVGGIGVIYNAWDLLDTLQQYNAYPRFVKAGPMIDLGSSVRELPEEERNVLQSLADQYHRRFKQAVMTSRRLPDDAPVFDGRVFSGEQAKQLGLVDEVGYLRAAMEKARSLAGSSDAKPVLYRRRNDMSRSLLGTASSSTLASANLMNISAPGLDRSKLPNFLYLWQPEPTLYPK